MADTTPSKRVLPARQRRGSTAKRRAMSPAMEEPAGTPVPTPVSQSTSEPRVKRKYTKRASVAHVYTPTRSASSAPSNPDEALPTRLTTWKPLPVRPEAQTEIMSNQQYQSIADSAILAASLQRSRMQWLCDGIFKKYWTKPVRRKGVVEQPVNNPDAKSMQKLGNATITVEPHTFDVTFYVVREAQVPSTPTYKYPIQPSVKPGHGAASSGPPPAQQVVQFHSPNIANMAGPSPSSKLSSVLVQPEGGVPASVVAPIRSATPPGPATKTTDPVIQMLASRAATDNSLKELMKVVATSRATPGQLKEFQAHIDEINGIVKKQNTESGEAKFKPAKTTASVPTPTPYPAKPINPGTYNSVHRNSPLGPGSGPTPGHVPHFNSYPVQPRAEAVIKHVVMEFVSPSAGQVMSTDRWLFPENTVLDLVYGGTEMTCSFFVERKGSDVLASIQDVSSEEARSMSSKWQADTEYYQAVTMLVKATQHRTIESIARSAKPLAEVQKYMQEVMEKKKRAPQEFLVYRLPNEKTEDFTDSAVELSGGDEDELKSAYPM